MHNIYIIVRPIGAVWTSMQEKPIKSMHLSLLFDPAQVSPPPKSMRWPSPFHSIIHHPSQRWIADETRDHQIGPRPFVVGKAGIAMNRIWFTNFG